MEKRLKIESRLRKARLYRDRADTVRGMASKEKDALLRNAMLKLADDYEGYFKDLLEGSEKIILPN